MTGSETQCDLCGLSLSRGAFSHKFSDAEKAFCCLGCLNVYTILSESGVIASGQDIRDSEVFKRSLALGIISNPEKSVEPGFQIPSDAPVSEMLLHVSGMWCGACSWLIEHSLSKERGVVSVDAFFVSDLVKVKYSPLYLPPEKITKRIEDLGYAATEYDPDDAAAKKENRSLLLRIGVAAFLWLNIMDLSVPLYVGYFEEIAPSVKFVFPFLLMALAAPIVFYSARPIFHLAWTGLLNKTIRMETLLATGILAAFIYSAVEAIRGATHVYFDTAAAIVTLVLAGKLLEKSAKQRAARSISMLYRLMPKKARLFVDNEERFVSIDALNNGDTLVVKAGERIPADGIVIDGETHADESLLTGESTPISKIEGNTVISGSVNIGNAVHVRATRTGHDTTLAQIIQLVEQAISSRSMIEWTVDKVSRIFVPGVIVAAAITFGVCFGFGITTSEEALLRAITVLVIACPCALGLATPLAVTAAVGFASGQGILVSDASVLEKVRDIDAVVLDKTGTVTEGNFELLHVALAAETQAIAAPAVSALGSANLGSHVSHMGSNGCFEADYLPLIAGVERYSEHPLGTAIVRFADSRFVTAADAAEISVEKGLGISGVARGCEVAVGNRRFVGALGLSIERSLACKVEEWEGSGHTVTYFVVNGSLKGAVAFGDSIRPDALGVIRQLKERGIKSIIVSGDAEATTRFVAEQTGVDDFRASAMPADKTEFIANLQASGLKVAMIGDGINDAPALAQADLGIAMGSGADIAMKAADIVLMGSSLEKILTVFDISKKTSRVVRQNLFWAFFYNAAGVSLAVTGMLNPIAAALAMLLSSLSVIGNSMRLSGSRNTK